jgi:hypothetical protein
MIFTFRTIVLCAKEVRSRSNPPTQRFNLKSLCCKKSKRLPTKHLLGPNGQLLIGLFHRSAHPEIVNPGLLESLLAQ